MPHPTDRGVRAVVEMAAREARALGHEYVGTEHLLLALTVQGPDPAAHLLNSAGITPTATRDEVIVQLGGDDAPLTEADADALATLGIDLGEVRRGIEEAFGEVSLGAALPCRSRVPRTIRLSRRSKTALRLSRKQAKRFGHASISPGHLLLALLQDESALAVKVIRLLGETPEALRLRTLQVVAGTA